MAGLFLRTYSTTLDASTAGSTKVRISIRKASSGTFATGSDWSPASGDVKVSKDGGAEANIGTLPAYSNGQWEFVLSGTELTAKNVHVRVSNAAVDDEDFNVETFGNSSAMYPTNYEDGVRLGMTALPNAAAAASGGLVVIGTTANTFKSDSSAQVTAASVQGNVTGSVASVTGNVGGNVVGSVASVTAGVTVSTNNDKTGYALSQTFPTNFSSLAITSGGIAQADLQTIKTQAVTAAAGVTFPASIASPTNITAGTITTVTNVTNAPTAGDFTAAMKTSLDAATPAVTVSDKTGFALTAAYDAAKTAGDATASNQTAIFNRIGAPAGASIAADIAAIKTDSASLLTNLASLAGKLTGITSLRNWLQAIMRKGNIDPTAITEINADNGIGAGTFDPTTDSEEAIVDAGAAGLTQQQVRDAMKLAPSAGDPDAGSIDDKLNGISAGSGSGAFTIIVPVTDGTDPLQNILVSMTLNGIAYTARTDADGNATFNLDAGTYTRAATYPGYNFAGDSATVTESDTLADIEMTAVVLPTPSTGQCTVSGIALDPNGAPTANITITFQAIITPNDGSGIAYSGATASAISDANGTYSVLLPAGGVMVEAWSGTGARVPFQTGVSGASIPGPSIIAGP
jgi:hypothetical protein